MPEAESRKMNTVFSSSLRYNSFSLMFRVSFLIAIMLLFILIGLFCIFNLQMFNQKIKAHITNVLNQTFSQQYHVKIGSSLVNFDSRGQLGVEIKDFKLISINHSIPCDIKNIRISFNPWYFLVGSVAITKVDVSGLVFKQKLQEKEPFFGFSRWRVDAFPDYIECIFKFFDKFSVFVAQDALARLSGLSFTIVDDQHRSSPFVIRIENLLIYDQKASSMLIESNILLNRKKVHLMLVANKQNSKIMSFKGTLSDVPLRQLTLEYNHNHGLDADSVITFSVQRANHKKKPSFSTIINVHEGTMYYYGISEKLRSARLELEYDNNRHAMNIRPSIILLSNLSLPFSGLLIDLERLDSKVKHKFNEGIGIDILLKGGQFKEKALDQDSLIFDVKVSGEYSPVEKELYMDNLDLSSPLGAIFGSLKIRYDQKNSPEISFGGHAESIKTAAIKQFWPFWVTPDVHNWVEQNLYGGTVSDASISIFIAQGRLNNKSFSELQFTPQELKISFDIEKTSLNIIKDIPPLKDTIAHFDLLGSVVNINIKKGTAYFLSGHNISLVGGSFVMPSIYEKPLMSEIRFSLSGDVDTMSELLSYKPFQRYQGRYGFKNISGHIEADIEARVYLADQSLLEKSTYKVNFQLHDVQLLQFPWLPLTQLKGSFNGDSRIIHLNATGKINKIDSEISIDEPIDNDYSKKRIILLTIRSRNNRKKNVFEDIKNYIGGSMKIEMQNIDEKRQKVNIDLIRATMFIPWFGWYKPFGRSAHLVFDLMNDSAIQLSNIRFESGGAIALGDISFDNKKMLVMKFSKLRFSSEDNFSLNLNQSKQGWDIILNGKALDVRSLVNQLRYKKNNDFQDYASVALHINIDKVIGFNDQFLNSFRGSLVMNKGIFLKAGFSSNMQNGKLVTANKEKDQKTLIINSNDAGILAKFFDCYRRMKGGSLDLRVDIESRKQINGQLEVSNFSLVDEKNLQFLVSVPVDQNGRSLNGAVKRDINISSGDFQKFFVNFNAGEGNVIIKNGILRGSLVGASFQGTLRDVSNKIDMTGTFMPIYGLNQLFSKVPLIGTILGNGQDHGLIGITFKLSGDSDLPKLSVNPLSLIAPGVFRKIFAYQ
ncbi:Large heme utilization/adhesion protein [Liberibacter crescens BT-1]|uniref:Large heme utilization/adhesion protein n=1 Tax=Liberibacter crescens (strain BT-1) TaxID=1215343 RepID=L0EW15_LIBCB|nr:DUF3971 domain-containing protein [Liberibacter crescens]AGA64561.1 Large heme utilization/adhesion protein [Liberibacter crescens BT-1]AMC12704.1 hypothetical protein RL73_02965 [Liberibacter crescens]